MTESDGRKRFRAEGSDCQIPRIGAGFDMQPSDTAQYAAPQVAPQEQLPQALFNFNILTSSEDQMLN